MDDRISEVDIRPNAEYQESIDKIIKWGLVAFSFLFPLVYSPLNFDSYGLPRLVVLRVASLFLALFWFIKIVKTGRLVLVRRPVLIPLGFYILISFLSSLNSVHPFTSFYGSFTRYEGFFTVFNYAFLFLLVANFFNEFPWVIRVLRAIIAATGLVAIFGLYQYVHSSFSLRAFSTFMNPDFLGCYLVIVIPLGVGLILVERDYRLTALWFFASILLFVCLAITFTRGAWLGFLGSIVCLVLMPRSYLWKKGKRDQGSLVSSRKGRVWVIGLLIFFVLSGIAISYISRSSSLQGLSMQRRLASIVQVTGGTAKARIELWRGALRMTARRPLLGWGPDTLSLVYPRYKSTAFIQLEGSEVTPDKTHNELLQVGATLGLVGLTAYLWFLITLFGTGYFIFKNLKSHDLKILIASALAAGAGYLVAVQFLFSEISFSPFFWMIMGLMLAMGQAESIPTFGINIHLPILPRAKFKWTFLIVALLTIILVLINNGKVLLADFYLEQARRIAEEVVSGRLPTEAQVRSKAYYEQALTLNSNNPVYFLSFGGSLLRMGKRVANENLLALAIEKFRKAIAINPRIEEAYLGLGDGCFWMGEIGEDRHYWRDAERAYQKVIKLDPNRALAYFKLGQLFVQKKQIRKAMPYFRKAIRVDFRYEENTLTFSNKLQESGRLKEAEQLYQELVSWNPRNANALNDLAVLYAQTSRIEKAIKFWNKAVTLDPSNSDLYFNLGKAYEYRKRGDLALKYYQKAVDINPADQRAREALERLREEY